jgi:hypothetical protein
MSRWTDYRAGKHRRTPHVARPKTPSTPARTVKIDKTDSPEDQARQARLVLQEMGLVYSCLSLYLSSRIDLLPVEFCQEFELTPDNSPPISAAEIYGILEQELGTHSWGAFLEFNYVPLQTTLIAQSHSAKLASGIPVVVIILRPEYYALQTGSEMLPSFDKDLVRQLCGPVMTDEVFVDFFSALRRKANFAIQGETLENIAANNSLSELLFVPKIYHELSTARIVSLEPVESKLLGDSLQGGHCSTDLVARRLCQVWLQQALCGNGFPVDPRPYNVALTNDNKVFFASCDLTALSASSRDNLWNYLIATMVDDPDRATLYLLREMQPRQNMKADGHSFRTTFRQAAYFGALAPVLGTNSNALPQLIFQHWKTALEHGQAPKPDLLCFYRGLFSIARIAYRLAPVGDPMREGIEEVRAYKTMDQVREIADWRYWFQNSDKFATAFITLPKIMDDALTHASVPNQFNPSVEKPDSRPQTTQVGLSGVTVVLVLAAVILSSHSQTANPANPMTEKLALLLLLLVGLVALRQLGD